MMHLEKILKICFIVSIFFVFAKADVDISNDTKDAIVKIYAVSQIYNYKQPWNGVTTSFNGSGCIIEGNKILTNAHVVADQTYIEVKRYGSTQRIPARVLHISHQADLAIITVDDSEFFKGVKPLKLDDLPTIQQTVTVCGFPAGGNTLSVTNGIVSRIEHLRYVHGGEKFLAIQVDAAINSGNSGGPAISKGKIVGIVMQGMLRSQSIGYLVPTNIIKHFLTDIKDGKLNGFADIGIATQKVESTTLREMYGMDENSTGQLLIELVYNSCAKGILKVGDIITHIDGNKINNDGTVEFRHHEFTYYKHFIDSHQIGEELNLDIIRAQKPLKVKIKLQDVANDHLLVKTTRYDKVPTYYIYGGYVFVPLTKNLLNSGKRTSTKLRYLASRWPTNEQREIVVLLKVLASKLSQGNYNMSLWPIKTVNGNTFATFKDFYTILENFKGDYLLLKDDEGLEVVIDSKESLLKNDEILQKYNIEYDRSKDLRK